MLIRIRPGYAPRWTGSAARAVGEVVVPFGVCAEPSNVQAGGEACPYRFRCVGCDHFRTDASYLPDLHTYLDDLLRNRERLRASVDVDDWARAEATPSDEEITRIRRLINRITGDLDSLDETERAQVEQAVAVVRRHRATMLGMPRTANHCPTSARSVPREPEHCIGNRVGTLDRAFRAAPLRWGATGPISGWPR
jgi:hypothetical protein